jgi:phosphatidylglycerophosphate synthase
MPNLTGEETWVLIIFFAIFILPIIITGIHLYLKSKKNKTKYKWGALIKVILAVFFILLGLFGTAYQSNTTVYQSNTTI